MKDGIMYNQNEIVLIPFPYSDLSGAKQRPALIISNETLNSSEDRICCLVTSNLPENGVLIKKENFDEGSLPFKSWVKPHRIFTINQKIIRKKLCKINNNLHTQVIEVINDFLS